MEKGKVPENVLKRSVMKQITKRRPEVVLGSGVGEDCAAVQLQEDEILVMSTDPITGATVDIGDLAVLITVNDLASSGAEPIGILLTIMLPVKSREIVLKNIMSQVSAACAKANVQIMGGHTEVTDVVNQPLISVTGVGKVKKRKTCHHLRGRTGDGHFGDQVDWFGRNFHYCKRKRGRTFNQTSGVHYQSREEL